MNKRKRIRDKRRQRKKLTRSQMIRRRMIQLIIRNTPTYEINKIINKKNQHEFDDKLIMTPEILENNLQSEINRSMNFVKNGRIIGTAKQSEEQLKQQLASIKYEAKNHKNYTYKFVAARPDARHIYIEELNNYFNYS